MENDFRLKLSNERAASPEVAADAMMLHPIALDVVNADAMISLEFEIGLSIVLSSILNVDLLVLAEPNSQLLPYVNNVNSENANRYITRL